MMVMFKLHTLYQAIQKKLFNCLTNTVIFVSVFQVLLVTKVLPTHLHKVKTKGFEVYVEQFENESGGYGRPTKIRDVYIHFDHLNVGKPSGFNGGYLLGLCVPDSFSTPEVLIDEKMWKTLSETSRKNLIFHELGHCVYGYKHVKSKESLMNPIIMLDDQYFTDPDGYDSEFFNPKYGE